MSAGVAERRKKSVQRRVLSDDVVEYLIDAILDGTLQPGEKVVELQAARMLDVSQATVREALRELEVRGFLESRPFRGTYVRKFTIRGLQDYFRTRTELEILAARWAMEAGFKTLDHVHLKECLDEMETYVSREDHVSFRTKDMEFHRTVVQGSGSESLLSSWSALCHSYWAYFGLHFEQKKYNLNDQMEKHKAIYDLLLLGQLDGLRKAILDHYVNIDLIDGAVD